MTATFVSILAYVLKDRQYLKQFLRRTRATQEGAEP